MQDPWIYTPPTQYPMALPAPPATRRVGPQVHVVKTTPVPRQDKGAVHGMVRMGVSVSLAAIAAALCFYHGYKRNGNDVWWGLAWGGAGFWCPAVAVPFAFSQGFARRG